MAAEGSYQLGFQVHPLTDHGGLDTSLDSDGRMHNLERDQLWKLAAENREKGNNEVKASQYAEAIGRYSEALMQLRSLEEETDVRWDDAARLNVRELRSALYLNLSMCFLKSEAWNHCVNAATRAIQGDKLPPDARDAVLAPDKKAKALFRRAQARCEGFGNFEEAKADLKKALELQPDDKSIENMLRKCQYATNKTSKAADKKMAGFLNSQVSKGDGLFDDKLRERKPEPAKDKDMIKMSDGLWVVPEDEKKTKSNGKEDEDAVDEEELDREIKELREANPEVYAEMREKIKTALEEQAAQGEGAAEEEEQTPKIEEIEDDEPQQPVGESAK